MIFRFLARTNLPINKCLLRTLSKAANINLTLVETRFNLDNTIDTTTRTDKLVRDMFITCSADRDGIYTFTINLELENPFKMIELHFEPPRSKDMLHNLQVAHLEPEKVFHIALPQTSFLIQLSQSVSYDECLTMKNAQLSSTISYELDCPKCTPGERAYLDRVFKDRMSQIDYALDTLLSEKLSLGLGVLLSQRRLYLDLETKLN